MNKTKFYPFHQNNSGGYYILNNDVQHYVIIEGYDLWQIESKANQVFHDYRVHCECCGERWDDDWIHERYLTDEPMINEESVYNYNIDEHSWDRREEAKVIIYYLDGRKELVNLTSGKGEMI